MARLAFRRWLMHVFGEDAAKSFENDRVFHNAFRSVKHSVTP